jgi:hypothetical protein
MAQPQLVADEAAESTAPVHIMVEPLVVLVAEALTLVVVLVLVQAGKVMVAVPEPTSTFLIKLMLATEVAAVVKVLLALVNRIQMEAPAAQILVELPELAVAAVAM